LAQVVDLLSLSTAMVTNDSGLMHVGAALARPLLALYGATSPEFTPPMSPAADLLVSDLDCAPCFQRECPLAHHRCMRDITPAQATARLAALLDRLA
jgi:heptosyltransferase-2